MYRPNNYEKILCYDMKEQMTLGILDTEFNQNNKSVRISGMNNALKFKKMRKSSFQSGMHQSYIKLNLRDAS